MDQTPIQSPVSSSVPPVAPPMPQMIVPKKSGGMVLKIIGLVVILAIIGAGVALASRIWDPAWSPFRPNPQSVLDTAFDKMGTWKTSATDMNMNLRVKDDSQKLDIGISADGIGQTDVTDKDNPKSSSSFNVSSNIGVAGAVYKINIGLQQIQVTNNLAYLNLKTIELPQEFSFLLPMIGIDISKIKNQWIKIDAQEIQQLAGATSGVATIANDQQKQLIEQIEKILLAAKLNKIKEQLSNESIDNQIMYHYLVTVDKNELKKVIKDFVNTLGSTMGNLPDTSAMDSQLDIALSQIGDIDYQVWIGQKDGELRKVKFAKSIDASKFSTGQVGTIEIGFEISYSEINKPVSITEPATSKTPQEVFPFLEQMIADKKQQALQQTLSLDMTSLHFKANEIYKSDKNFNSFNCSDARIKALCDDIKSITGAYPIIHQSQSKYCAYVKGLSDNVYTCNYWDDSLHISVSKSYLSNPASTCTSTKFACPSK